MKVFASIDDALRASGNELGVSDWRTIDQSDIDRFADLTGDQQWIHVDVDRARAESPFGATIAHGFLTLSLLPALTADVYAIRNAKLCVNYGIEKARFVAPVKAASRVRARCTLASATQATDDSVSLTINHVIEIDGLTKPAMTADMIIRAIY